MSYTVEQIAALISRTYRGDGAKPLERVSKWETADEKSLIFVDRGERNVSRLENIRAGCIIAPEEMAPAGASVIFS